jgi:hypothetical protein
VWESAVPTKVSPFAPHHAYSAVRITVGYAGWLTKQIESRILVADRDIADQRDAEGAG